MWNKLVRVSISIEKSEEVYKLATSILQDYHVHNYRNNHTTLGKKNEKRDEGPEGKRVEVIYK